MFNKPERRGWAAGWERAGAREKEIRLKSERGKCSHSQGLWDPYIAANYLLSEVISFRTAERHLMQLAIKCPYVYFFFFFYLKKKKPFLRLPSRINPCTRSCQVAVVVCCQRKISTKGKVAEVTSNRMLIEANIVINCFHWPIYVTFFQAIKIFLEAGETAAPNPFKIHLKHNARDTIW